MSLSLQEQRVRCGRPAGQPRSLLKSVRIASRSPWALIAQIGRVASRLPRLIAQIGPSHLESNMAHIRSDDIQSVPFPQPEKAWGRLIPSWHQAQCWFFKNNHWIIWNIFLQSYLIPYFLQLLNFIIFILLFISHFIQLFFFLSLILSLFLCFCVSVCAFHLYFLTLHSQNSQPISIWLYSFLLAFIFSEFASLYFSLFLGISQDCQVSPAFSSHSCVLIFQYSFYFFYISLASLTHTHFINTLFQFTTRLTGLALVHVLVIYWVIYPLSLFPEWKNKINPTA